MADGRGAVAVADLKAIYILWYREVLRLRRDRMRLIVSLVSPLLYLVVFGVGLSRPMGMLTEGINFTQFLFPGIVAMAVLMSGLMSGMAVVWEREMGFLREVLVAPVSRWSIVVGKTLGGSTVAIAQGLLLLILAPVVGISISLTSFLWLFPLLLAVAFALGALGVLIASRTHTMEGFQVMMNMFLMPLIFLSGIFFPVAGLPSWMNIVVKFNPVTYAVDGIRQLLLGDAAPPLIVLEHTMSILNDGLVVVALGSLVAFLAIWSFRFQE